MTLRRGLYVTISYSQKWKKMTYEKWEENNRDSWRTETRKKRNGGKILSEKTLEKFQSSICVTLKP